MAQGCRCRDLWVQRAYRCAGGRRGASCTARFDVEENGKLWGDAVGEQWCAGCDAQIFQIKLKLRGSTAKTYRYATEP